MFLVLQEMSTGPLIHYIVNIYLLELALLLHISLSLSRSELNFSWQLILDMHFTVEIARFAGYPSRHVHQIASAIIARAIRTFSARGIDPQR